MPNSLRIGRFESSALDIALLTPFGISGGAQTVAANVLVTLELSDGTRGYGEAAPLPPYNGETQAQALATLRDAQRWLEGRVLESEWRVLAAEFRQRGGSSCGSAQCAFESALLDAWNRRAGVPLWRFFGGAGTDLETDMTVTTGTPAEAAVAARGIRVRGIRQIKVKVGGKAGPAHDLQRLAAIHEVAPESPLILDGNAGVSRADATLLVQGLKARGITPALLEQWLAKSDLEGAAALRRESGWWVAADESVTTADDARRYRDADELTSWKNRDPLTRLGNYLRKKKLWDDKKEAAIQERAKAEVSAVVERAEGIPAPDKSEFFDHMYAELPEETRICLLYTSDAADE